MTTVSGPGLASMARRTAVSSILLLVVAGSPPLSWCAGDDAQAHPPGPGVPLHAPSVYTRSRSSPMATVWRTVAGDSFVRSSPRPTTGRPALEQGDLGPVGLG